MPVDATIGYPRNVEQSAPGEGASAQAARAAAVRAKQYRDQAETIGSEAGAAAGATAGATAGAASGTTAGASAGAAAGTSAGTTAGAAAAAPYASAAAVSATSADLSAQNAASMATVNGSFTTFALANAALASLAEGHSYEVTADPTLSNIGIWTKRSGVLVQTSTVTVQAAAALAAALGSAGEAPLDTPDTRLLILDPTTGRAMLRGRDDAALLGDMRNWAGEVLVSAPVAQAIADVVNARLDALGQAQQDGPLDSASATRLLILDPVSRRKLLEGLDDASILGDLRNWAGEVLVSGPVAQAMVDALGTPTQEAPLDTPDTAILALDPTTKRAFFRGRSSDGAMLGDWRGWDGVQLGRPIELYAGYRLRNVRDYLQRRKAAKAGLSGFGGTLIGAQIGTSWSASRQHYGTQLQKNLVTAFDASGIGWVQAGLSTTRANGAGITEDGWMTTSAGWVANTTISAPGLTSITSSTVGESLTLESPGVSAPYSASVVAQAAGAGDIRYRFNGGAWIALNIPTTLLAAYTFTGVPATAAWTMDLEVVSGAVTLFGFDVRSTAPGVRWHKIARAGSNTKHWTQVDPVDQAAGWQALGFQYVHIEHGVNDQILGGVVEVTPSQHYTNLNVLVTRLRAALPAVDILLITSPEVRVASGLYAPMSDYAKAARQVAEERATAHLDLQRAFGEAYADYAFGAPRELLDNSLIHPSGVSGRSVIAETIYRALVYSTS